MLLTKHVPSTRRLTIFHIRKVYVIGLISCNILLTFAFHYNISSKFPVIFHWWFNAMYSFASSPTVDTIACKPTSRQLVAVSCARVNAQRLCSPFCNL